MIRERFQEAKAVSALNHPNVIQVHDISSDAGVDFIAMEYVPGTTLDRRIGRKGLPVNEVLKCGVQVADALTAAHAGGIIRRDLKPTNIMVTEKGLIKVLDFGLAKLIQPSPDELSGGPERWIIDAVASRAFCPVEEGIYYMGMGEKPGAYALRFYDIAGSKSRVLSSIEQAP